MFLVTHKDVRKRPRVNAFFEFCVRELKPVLLQGMMRQTLPKDKPASVVHRELAQPIAVNRWLLAHWRSQSQQAARAAAKGRQRLPAMHERAFPPGGGY